MEPNTNLAPTPDTPVQRPVTKQELWERKLLDLSLRNPLLNYRPGSASLQCLADDLRVLEDELAKGVDLRLCAMPEETALPNRRQAIITRATTSLEPDEMPSTKGPAMGLAKNVCSWKPATESAPPRISAERSLGRRIFRTMLRTVSLPPVPKSAPRTSRGGMAVLPVSRLTARNSPRSRTRNAKQTV